jgi:predicted RNase H-like nuclease
MRVGAVLGIDAAWTLAQPSGIALVAKEATGWHLVGAAASYQRFLALADCSLIAQARPLGSLPDVSKLLAAASKLCGGVVDLVAVDMPLARSAIRGRRCSDNVVSRVYGARNCGTHTPNAYRPGPVSEMLNEGCEQAGYPLLTHEILSRGLIEVYPHPALLELTGASERLPYKAAKAGAYWPSKTPSERRACLFHQWDKIIKSLEREVAGVATALPRLEHGASGWNVKAYEDVLDAIVCAWVGIRALEGRATPYGDDDSAIWIPTPRQSVRAATT